MCIFKSFVSPSWALIFIFFTVTFAEQGFKSPPGLFEMYLTKLYIIKMYNVAIYYIYLKIDTMNYLWTCNHDLIMMFQSMTDYIHDDVPTLPNGSVTLICINILSDVHTVT